MSAQELFDLISQYPLIILGYFLLTPLFAALLGLLQQTTEGPRTALDYTYSALIYLAGIPGTISAVLIAYALFIVRTNLLEVDFLIYFLPVICMGATFYLIGRKTDFDRLPGFERLSGLMMLIGLTFLVVLIIFKLRIFIGFFASIESLLLLGLFLFILFKVAAKKFF
ncbi:MAG: hypothetical protein QGD92_08390 [Gammaproteobacteria bacterium]|nr:hypothetical protein [Gammaproteobacteria bacterium]